MQKALNHIELFGDGRTRLKLPFFRHDRQVSQIPARITAVIRIRLRLFQQMTNTPGDDLPVSALNKTIAFTVRFWQHIRNGAPQTRFFGNKQPHQVNESQP
ncbi:Uncharacterised protein [Salmonella enterica subsp. enterica serovar Bovismorbificans]|uniref:Uncharacterized protein n=1 Tax=Salmonella enterica subsp. enterica serovar Bovismorbificans TaxID=58097 RepID=A0A655BNY0_SALET|nr:Uncharacterised protein [Salmonella enterica subsp. enterica serovar Bovismorbificans]